MTPSMVLCSYWYVLCTEYILYLYLYSGNYTCIYDDTCDVDGDKVRLNQVTCIASARCSSLLLQYDTVWQRVLPLLYISSRIHIPCVSIQTLVRYAMFSARHKEAWAESWPWVRTSMKYKVRSFFVFFILASRQARMGWYEYYVWEDQVTILDYWNCSN